MSTRVLFFASLVVCAAATAAWPQDAPAPFAASPVVPAPAPTVWNAPAAPAATSQPTQGPSYSPPGAYPLPAQPQGVSSPAPGANSPPAGVYAAPAGAYAAPAGAYAAPPGAVMVVPGQPYAYQAVDPYAGPVVMAPAPMLVPAPPPPSYRWSVATEALFLGRDCGDSILLGRSLYNNPPLHLSHEPHPDSLFSDDEPFPLAAGLRLEVNRKLNDRVTLSGTYWGLQQWSVGETIYGDPEHQSVLAYSPYLQMSSLLNGLDHSLGYTNRSQVENAEFNALFRLNTYDPYVGLHWILGARYINFADQFTLTGVDDLNSTVERLDYHTTNNLVGGQTGLLFTHGWDRFQWETGVKFGLMGNIYHQHGTDAASDPGGVPAGFAPYDGVNNGSGVSALFEFSLAARFRLAKSVWFRLGYQFYDVTGLALAPRQLRGFGHGGNVFFDGLSLGLQSTW